jgi:hypothetical protein
MKRLGLVMLPVLLLLGDVGVKAETRVVPIRSQVAVYLVRDEHVSPVRRVVPGTTALAHASLSALLVGPTRTERLQGYSSAIPASTTLRSVSLSRGVLTVDLARSFGSGGGSLSMLLRVAQIVHTATQFPTIDRVAFKLDGKRVNAIGGEGVVVWPPVTRVSFEEQAPPILIEQPLPGDRVSTPLRIRGTANVFEAQLAIDVTTATGKLLVRRAVTASAGTGTRGRFSVDIPVRTSVKKLVVKAYDHSPKDGRPIDLVRVPVTVR